MPQYYGTIGFVETRETAPDVWTEELTEREYSGDVLRIQRRWQGSEHRVAGDGNGKKDQPV